MVVDIVYGEATIPVEDFHVTTSYAFSDAVILVQLTDAVFDGKNFAAPAVRTLHREAFECALENHEIGLVFDSGKGDDKAYWDVLTDRGLVRAGPLDVLAKQTNGCWEVISEGYVKVPE